MLVALSWPVKFSKRIFPVWNFVQSLKKPFLSVVANHSKSDFSTVNWVADSEEIRYVYSTEILSNKATIREVNSTEIDSFFYLKLYRERHAGLRAITGPSYKQPNKLSQLQKTQFSLLTVSLLAI